MPIRCLGWAGDESPRGRLVVDDHHADTPFPIYCVAVESASIVRFAAF
jgi:hypothetical protein